MTTPSRGSVEKAREIVLRADLEPADQHGIIQDIAAALDAQIEACAKELDRRAKWHKQGWDANQDTYIELKECATALREMKE